MTSPVLPDHNWKIAQKDENPLSAELTTMTFKLSASLSVSVTNIINGIHADVWLMLERHSDQSTDGRRKIMSFIGSAGSQTRALNNMRRYVWATYRKDISTVELPF